MKAKTIIIIILIVLITMVILQFIYNANFALLIAYAPKWEMVIIVAVLSFVLGILIGRRGKSKHRQHSGLNVNEQPDTLSDEDRKYIS